MSMLYLLPYCIYMQMHRPPHCAQASAHLLHTLITHIHTDCLTGSHPPTARPAVFPPDREEGTVQWATGVEHKVSGSRTKFPSRSQLAACLLGRELHHTERRPAWSAISDLSARESAGGKERQTERDRKRERASFWSIALWFGLMKLRLDRLKDVGLVEKRLCHHYMCMPAFLSHLINNLWVI